MSNRYFKHYAFVLFIHFFTGQLPSVYASSGCPCTSKENQVAWNTRNVPITNFGVITEKKIHKVSLPANNKFLCLFTPSTGNLKSKQLKLLLVGFSLNEPFADTIPLKTQKELLEIKESNAEVQSVIIVYHQLDNELLWIKAMTITLTAPLHELLELAIELEPDANNKIYPITLEQPLTPSSQPVG